MNTCWQKLHKLKSHVQIIMQNQEGYSCVMQWYNSITYISIYWTTNRLHTIRHITNVAMAIVYKIISFEEEKSLLWLINRFHMELTGQWNSLRHTLQTFLIYIQICCIYNRSLTKWNVFDQNQGLNTNLIIEEYIFNWSLHDSTVKSYHWHISRQFAVFHI